MHHAAGHRCRLKNGYRVTEQSEIVRRRHPRRAGTDDCYFFRMDNLRLAAEYIYGVSGLRAIALGHKTLQSADGDRGIKFSAAACGLAGMPDTRPQMEAKG